MSNHLENLNINPNIDAGIDIAMKRAHIKKENIPTQRSKIK